MSHPHIEVGGLATLRGPRLKKSTRWSDVYHKDGLTALLLLYLVPGASLMLERIAKVLSRENADTHLPEFRQSVGSDLNMVAVAGAIITQVAITGLSLEAMDQVHWTATGFLVISLIFGAMSVYNCFTVQQELNSLPESVALLNWLSRTQGPPQAQSTLHDATSSQEPIQTESFGMELRMQATPQVEGSMTGRLAEREASALAAVMLATPSGLLGLSVLAFIYGLGIYLGCVYTDNLAPGLGQGGSLGVLIFYILAALISRFLGILPRNTRASIFWQMLGA